MFHPILLLSAGLIISAAPQSDVFLSSQIELKAGASGNQSTILIAGSHADEDPHGDDPHGPDPHDEFHDRGMPANEKDKERKAPSDPYGGTAPNYKEPYR